MASNIITSTININFPVSGLSNNSQGFRDNFAAIKNNFVVSAREMNDLLNKVVVKSPLTYGPSPSGTNNNFNGAEIAAAVFAGCSLATANLNTITTGSTITVDYSMGSFQEVTLAGSGAQSSTLAFSNFPSTGNYAEVRLRVTANNTSHTLTVPANVVQYTSTLNIMSSRVITFANIGQYDFVFNTADAGGNISINDYTQYTAA